MFNASHNSPKIAAELDSTATPFHIFFRNRLNEDAGALKSGLQEFLPECELSFSVKTCPFPALLHELSQQGWLMQAYSRGDAVLALHAKAPASTITLGGSAWSSAEWLTALQPGIKSVVLDSPEQAEALLAALQQGAGKLEKIYFRVNDRHSHFGFSPHEISATLITLKNYAQFFGLHIHGNPSGSAVNAVAIRQDFLSRFETLTKLAQELSVAAGAPKITHYNLGGGIDTPFVYRPRPEELSEFHNPHKAAKFREQNSATRFSLKEVGQEIGRALTKINSSGAGISFEPGRAVCTRALATVCSVRAAKRGLYPDASIYVTDASTALLGPLHRGIHPLYLDEGASARKTIRTSFIYGRLPHEGDWLFQGLPLPDLKTGDKLLIEYTGAYFLPLEANFCEPRPGIFDAATGAMLRAPESLEDLTAREYSLR